MPVCGAWAFAKHLCFFSFSPSFSHCRITGKSEEQFPKILSANCRPTVGWPSADRRPRDGQPLASSRPSVGNLLVTCWQCVTNTLNTFDGWLSGKSLSLKKSIGSEGSCDMSGHNTWNPTSIFRVSNQKKLATVWKDATSYYNRLLTSTKPSSQMLSFTIVLFHQRTARTMKYGVIRKYCWKVYSAQV